MALPLGVAMLGLGVALSQSGDEEGVCYDTQQAPEYDAEMMRAEGRVPPEVRHLEGRGLLEHQPPPKGGFDPIAAEWAINAVPGRYDNLPRLQSVMKDSRHELQPWMSAQYDYENLRRGSTLLENQLFHRNLTPQETPLRYGVLPEAKRSTGVMLRDPDPPEVLKPQKRENLDTDMFVAHGDPLRERYEPVTWQLHKRALETSRYTRGTGALDGFQHVDNPQMMGGALRGFAQGEVQTPRSGGFHPRERFFRVPETRRGRNQHALRALNANPSQIGNPGSIYQPGTAPLGELRHNNNYDVREWHRAPERTDGVARRIRAPNEFVDMPHTNRDTGFCARRRQGKGGVRGRAPHMRRHRRQQQQQQQGMRGRSAALEYNPDVL